ncbi:MULTISPECIES: heavy metal translocating P-type ATPase [unclassified Granulicatella]|uniref:heavy metal translocating P-type ATPase n=1 Tax=unclassified Granulicatella TaxID=2630493 RepID=UPI0010748717|nr:MULTISPECIES: heavy metal translocating P-type ATPase [unclassified Granulicatella]MBF0779979.1 copper-translocating P-type ATPase [Granulicatella sp. 19428wC4_WM01]TFU95995.1 copper-translocating P-type ATPase [Granulicatella sp. WM01]
MRKIISIHGMSCASCANRIEKAIQQLSGVQFASVNFAQETLDVTYEKDQVLSNVYQEIEALGYQIHEPLSQDVLSIEGMSCANCASRIERSIREIDGVDDVQVNFAIGKAYIKHDEKVSKQQLVTYIEELGYTVKTIGSTRNHVDDEMKKRVIFSIACVIPLLYLSMGHMLSLPFRSFLHHALTMAGAQLILSIPIVWVNRSYYTRGFKYLWQRQPNMDSLVALGTLAAFIQGIIAIIYIAFGQTMDIYFESGAVILTLITVGKYFEYKAKKQTTRSIQSLINLAPNYATIVEQSGERQVPIEFVRVGDLLVSKAGEQIAIDGVVEKGNAQVDESMITGESMPVSKTVGDYVIGASLNSNGVLYYRVNRIGEDTTLSQIRRFVEEAQGSKAPIAKLADTLSRYFVPIVLILACLTLIGWVIMGSIYMAWNTFIAVLVIACPCALGLATPTAIMVSTGKGAEHGILIKNGEALELASHIQTVILDKTGTITQGRPVVSDIITSLSQEDLLQLAGSVENLSTHPLAKAVVHKARQENIELLNVEQYTFLEGLGVYGEVRGKKVYIGNAKLLANYGVDVAYTQESQRFAEEQKTALFVVVDNVVQGVLAISDAIKQTSYQAIQRLQEKGIEVIMVSGDNHINAQAIANKVGIEKVYAQVLPQEKAEIIQNIQAQGRQVAMVGDGINDAPALVQAQVGIAIGQGTDVAIESADIVLMHSDLNDVVKAIELSQRTLKTIKENLFFAFIYNVLGIPIAMGLFYPILLNPMLAGLAMSFSSISVVLNALRLRYVALKLDKGNNKGEQ